MNNFSVFLLMLVSILVLSACEFSDDDNNYNNDGDVNIYDNFRNLKSDDIEFDGKVKEIQYDISTVPDDEIDSIVDVNGNDSIDGCFEYTLAGFTLNVDSVDHFISDDTKITLEVYADLSEEILVYEENMNGIAFEEVKLSKMFDEDVNDFIYKIRIEYQERPINSIDNNVDVDGMLFDKNWNDYND